MKQPKQQQKLGALIRDLERELTEGKTHAAALQEIHERLRETERICQELADENRRLGEEITAWQERLAASEENQSEVSLLRQQLDELQIEYACATDRNRQMEAKVAESGRILAVEADKSPSSQAKELPAPERGVSRAAEGGVLVPDSVAALERKPSPILFGWVPRNWQLGAAFAGVVMLIIAGAVTVKNLRSDTPASRELISNPEVTITEPVADTVSKAALVRGAFQTVRPTQVFSAPSDASELIVNIGQGTKVNVVDARDGWLEIRSKHGRPPGFIRQETAVRASK